MNHKLSDEVYVTHQRQIHGKDNQLSTLDVGGLVGLGVVASRELSAGVPLVSIAGVRDCLERGRVCSAGPCPRSRAGPRLIGSGQATPREGGAIMISRGGLVFRDVCWPGTPLEG